MGRIFITSDLHFSHNKEFLFVPRGFERVEDMMEHIVQAWIETVAEDDDVYILGDLMLNDTEETVRMLSMLSGRIHIILGNHDTDRRVEVYRQLPNVVEICYARPLKYGHYHFWLSHYPTLVSNYDDDKPLKARVIALCGHTHTSDPFHDWDKGLIYHCELDAHNNRPVLIDDIIEDIKQKISSQNLLLF